MSKRNSASRRENRSSAPHRNSSRPVKVALARDVSFWVRTLIVLQLIFVAWQFSPSLCTNGDNARYLNLGKALIEGRGYRNIQEPSEPIESQFPVLFPAILGFGGLFTDSFVFPKIIISIFASLILLLLFHTYRNLPVHILMPVLACTAMSGLMAEYSTILMSEIPYLLFSILALYLLKKSFEKPDNRLLFWAATAMSIAPINCRSIGLAFSIAWILYCLAEKKPRYAIMHSVMLILTVSIFKSFVPSTPYILQLFQRNSYEPEAGFATAAELFMRILENTRAYFSIIIRNSLIPFAFNLPPFIGSFLSKMSLILIAAGWLRFLFHRSLRIIGFYLFFYTGILLVWQAQWSGERFIVSIVPFLYMALFLGMDALISFFRLEPGEPGKSLFKRIISGFIAPPPLKTIRSIWIAVSIIIFFNISYGIMNSGARKAPGADWKNFYSCADWARIHSRPEDVFLCRKPELFYVRSKRKCNCYPYTHDVEKIIEVMKADGIKYVVHDNFAWTKTTAKYLYPAVSAHPEMFRIVYALKNPDTFILEFLPK